MKYLLIVSLCVSLGCGGAEVKKIVVTVSRNQEPLPDVTLLFWPDTNLNLGSMATAATNHDGLVEYVPEPAQGQGFAGDYRVAASSERDRAALFAAAFGRSPTMPKLHVPLAYGREGTTPLRATLQPGVNELEFEISDK